MLIGVGLLQSKKHDGLSKLASIYGLICIFFIDLLFSDPLPNYTGLYQRIIEGTFILWIITCSIFIKKSGQLDIKIG